MKHVCPVCDESCECEDYELYGDCSHCPPYRCAEPASEGVKRVMDNADDILDLLSGYLESQEVNNCNNSDRSRDRKPAPTTVPAGTGTVQGDEKADGTSAKDS